MNFRPAFLSRLFAQPIKDDFARELDERLAARKALRAARSQAAIKGWQTRRSA